MFPGSGIRGFTNTYFSIPCLNNVVADSCVSIFKPIITWPPGKGRTRRDRRAVRSTCSARGLWARWSGLHLQHGLRFDRLAFRTARHISVSMLLRYIRRPDRACCCRSAFGVSVSVASTSFRFRSEPPPLVQGQRK